MPRTRDGATLEGICKKFGWQAHTTRALMSAGGSLAKKHGIPVIRGKVGDSRIYRIARKPEPFRTGCCSGCDWSALIGAVKFAFQKAPWRDDCGLSPDLREIFQIARDKVVRLS